MTNNLTQQFQQAMNEASQMATIAMERQRAMLLLGICEIISHRAPTARHIVFSLDSNMYVRAHIDIEDADGRTLTGLFDHTSVEELSLEYFGGNILAAGWVTKVGELQPTEDGHTVRVALHDIAGKNPTNMDPAAFLDAEWRLEESVIGLLQQGDPGQHFPHELVIDKDLQVLSWCDGDDCEITITAEQQPILAANYTAALERLAGSTHTSWKWTRIDPDQWSYAPEGSFYL